MTRLTGVVNKVEKANKADRANIRAQTEVMRADFNKRLVKAIATGEARAKAIEQRLQSNLKSTVRILRVELASSLDQAADKVLKIVAGKRHKIADNYLSLKAYSVAAADKVTDYTAGKNGRNLSSIGDLLRTVALNGAVKAPKAMGLGMGGTTLRSVFGTGKVKVKNSVAAVHGLVNEYTKACKTVRANWPMGLGKYLMDRLETSMLSKGVLQVDKISGKKGHYVYINGRSVGLSNKLNDFASLAARMSVYENVLAKLTSKLPSTSSGMHRMKNVMPPQWKGN
jgi:phosphotransferase system IIB component